MSHTPTQTQAQRPSLRRHDGFTLVLVLGVLLITSLLLVAAFTAANGEIHLTGTDLAQKKAYYAAEAGIENYEYHLTQDGNYLTYCTTPTPANKALNQYYKTGTKTPRVASELSKVEVPGSTGEEYALQLVPALTNLETSPECNKNNVVGSMIEEKEGPAAGTFQIQSTGFSGKAKRTLVATLRNANFVSYVWYSVYETGDPSLYGEAPANEPTRYTKCGAFYTERPSQCQKFNNYFISNESVNGPMHTEDHVGICGNPVFGRSRNDRIEFGNGNEKAAKVGYSGESACSEGSSKPEFVGKQIAPAEDLQITPPPGDEELAHIVEPAYKYTGKTEILLQGETMSVSKWKEVGEKEVKETQTGVAFPSNGVIYVAGGEENGCEAYSPFGPSPSYTEGFECGNVYVRGEYTKALTIAAANDVIINGNVFPSSVASSLGSEPTGNAMLGLIANNFVRVYHPLTGTRQAAEYTKCGTATNDTAGTPEIPEDLKNPYIYAAILALKHSFIVDNFDCGKPNLEKLNVYGAVAGEFTNGMTGVFSGTTAQNGYPYNLRYDNRLQAAEPPHFLNPVEAAWYIQRQTTTVSP